MGNAIDQIVYQVARGPPNHLVIVRQQWHGKTRCRIVQLHQDAQLLANLELCRTLNRLVPQVPQAVQKKPNMKMAGGVGGDLGENLQVVRYPLPTRDRENGNRVSLATLQIQPLNVFLKKELKKMLYSRRKSAKEFYAEEGDRSSVSGYVD